MLTRGNTFWKQKYSKIMANFVVCLILVVIALCSLVDAAKKAKIPDPRDCEVCISNLNAIDKLVPSDKKSDKLAIEKAIGTHCTLSGFGSEWKPNPALTSPKVVLMFEPDSIDRNAGC